MRAAIAGLAIFLGLGQLCRPTSMSAEVSPAQVESHRSPIDLALLPDGRRALTANHTADSVSLVDIQSGKVLAEVACGRKPVAVACSADGKHAAVSNLWSGTVTLLDVQKSSLKVAAQVQVGGFPRGLAFAQDGKSFYVAVAAREEILHIDWASRQVRTRWPAPGEPRQLAISNDSKWLAAASSRSGQVRCWSLITGKIHWERVIDDAFNLRGLIFAPDGKSILCAHAVRREFPVSKENIEEGWVIDSRITRLALEAHTLPFSWQIALDTRGQAVGDPQALAFGKSGSLLAVAAGGTHELLLLDVPALPWNAGDPGDFIDSQLHKNKHFRRVHLGGRPVAIAFAGVNAGEAVLANYLLDAIQVVDVRTGKMRSIPLGSPGHDSLQRKGEALFYDAQRSHHHWFSCHTCHVDGHTCCLNFDTLNDDSYGTPKLTPSLRNVAKTGPWTWHGWQKDLGAGVAKSLSLTMFGPKPSEEDITALLAFLKTVTAPPNPLIGPDGAPSPAALRGKQVFHAKANCIRCHRGPYYTSPRTYDVKLHADGSPHKLWNPPSLLGLFDRAPYLHDGRAKSLPELLQKHHTPEMVGGEALTAEERADLIAFLLSL